METDILQYLPDWFRQIKDYQALMRTESGQFEVLAAYMDAVHRNFYLGKADVQTVEDWERLFSITPNPSVETLEFRRSRIINRLSATPPFTLPFLYERLNLLIGKGKWSIVMDYPSYTLYVDASAENQAWAGEVLATINTVKPCHIAYISRPLVVSSICISEIVGLTDMVQHYRLGYWGLGARAFSSMEDRGVIIMPNQKTLQPQMLADAAAFIATDVACVRINGTVLISSFSVRSASGDTATIEYMVNAAHTKTVMQIELLNRSGKVLELASVYVPVSDPVQITHRIPVKEGN